MNAKTEKTRTEVTYVGIDDWNRPIFKDELGNFYGSVDILFSYGSIESKVMAKVTTKDLTYFGSRFNCEPMGTPVNDIEIVWTEGLNPDTIDQSHIYALLDRLRSDCDYFLGYGEGCVNRLWAGSVSDQIEKMLELHAELINKPEWLTLEQINEYKRKMTKYSEVV